MRNLFLVILILATLPVVADNITGNVKDQQGQPMPYVTISALNADSSLITGTITDENGNYVLDGVQQNVILQASFVGFNTVTGGPDFVLSEEATELDAVEVKAKRPLIERQLDKLVVNVSESPIAAGSNLTNVLRRAPGVRVDKDGNVTVNGKSVEVYIDNRPSYMSGEQLKGLLEGTDGSTIEKIEIITNPSAKYDASGQGGIINIKLKKNKMQGLNGTLTAMYGGMYFGDIKRWVNQDMASLNLNYRTQKTYTNIQLTQVYADINQMLEIGTSNPDTTIVTRNEFNGNFQFYTLRASNDWMIDSVNTFGFIFQAPIMKMGYQSAESKMNFFMPQHTANLNFTHVFNSDLEREITVNVDYNRNNNRNNNEQIWLSLITKQQVDIASAKLDFQTMFWKTGMIECGVKYVHSRTGNTMITDSIPSIPNPTLNNFVYNENVAAAYISAAKQFSKVNIKLGLRGEYTYSVGRNQTIDSTNCYSYFNLFPTAFVGYNPTEKWAMSVSYTRRIKRPTYFILNPFRTYVDAHNYSSGNPTLTPEFNNDVEINFAWSQYISLTGNFSHTQDMFGQQTLVLPNGDAEMRWQNFGTCTTHGVQLAFTEIPIVPKYVTAEDGTRSKDGAWLTFNANIGYYNFLNKSYSGQFRNQNHHWNANGNFTAYLPKFWTISLDGYYSSPLTVGYDYTSAMYGMDFGVRKVFPTKGVILNLNVQDLLRSSWMREEARGMVEGTSSFSNYNFRQQRVTLTVIYNFGKQEWHKARKVGDMDENSRMGGGNSIGK